MWILPLVFIKLKYNCKTVRDVILILKIFHNGIVKVNMKVTQLCLTLCNPMVHGILQARMLEWVAFAFSRESSQPRDWIQVSHIVDRCFTLWATREILSSVSSVTQSCPALCDPMNHSTPGLPVHHQLPESTRTHVHWVDDAIQLPHPLSSPSPPALNPFQHQGLFQWVSSLHQVAKVLEVQL